uniref:ABC transporter ATP-binding protein n=1 Tax=Ignisphaera aggregans TaxID=334771 RepID=A0A7J2U3Z9_9CREN
MGEDVVIDVRGLDAVYDVDVESGVYVHAVDDVNLQVRRGEVLGIAGESGCGKSTLARVLYGFVNPPLRVRRGSVVISADDGKYDVVSLSLDERRARLWWKVISYIPQNAMNVLNPVERIRDHFIEVLKYHSSKADVEEVARYLEGIGLKKEVLNAYPHQLSGGMRQRIVIALALLLNPRIVIADEPTTAVDVVLQRGILQLLVEFQKRLNNTLVVITHDMGVHAMITNRVAVMYAGNVVEVGETSAVFEKPLHPYTQGLINSLPRIGDKSTRVGLAGSPPDLRNPPPGCRFHPRCPFAMDICRREKPPFIEVEKSRFVACWLHVKR